MGNEVTTDRLRYLLATETILERRSAHRNKLQALTPETRSM